jgi:hypothetical protein
MQAKDLLVIVLCAAALVMGNFPAPKAADAQVLSTDNPFCPALPAPFGMIDPPCANGMCPQKFPYNVDNSNPDPTPAPPRSNPSVAAGGRERSVVTKRSRATRMHKRGFFARVRARDGFFARLRARRQSR